MEYVAPKFTPAVIHTMAHTFNVAPTPTVIHTMAHTFNVEYAVSYFKNEDLATRSGSHSQLRDALDGIADSKSVSSNYTHPSTPIIRSI